MTNEESPVPSGTGPTKPKAYIGTAPRMHQGPHEWVCIKCEEALGGEGVSYPVGVTPRCHGCGRKLVERATVDGFVCKNRKCAYFWKMEMGIENVQFHNVWGHPENVPHD